MKKILLSSLFVCVFQITFAQYKKEAEKYVQEGVAYHDKGDYEGAIKKYDLALQNDKDNLLALAEKAFSLLSLQKFDEAIACCQRAIETHPGDDGVASVYVTYGNAADGLKKTDRSIEIYDEGIKKFPDYYQLHFNKGITYSSVKKYDDAILSFQKSVMLNPKHGSSHNAIARVMNIKKKRIPAVLAYGRFLVIEPESKRGKENFQSLQTIMKGNVEQTGKKSFTINISSDMLGDSAVDGKRKENNFTSTDLILSLDAALDHDKKNKKKSEVELFIRKMETITASLSESKSDNFGFFWEYYVPYFIEMKDKKFLETFGHIVFASSEDPEVSKWLKSHKTELEKFYEWSKGFAWKKS